MKTTLTAVICFSCLAPYALVEAATSQGSGGGGDRKQAIANRSYRQEDRQTIIGRSVVQRARSSKSRLKNTQHLELAPFERTQRYQPLIDYFSKLNRIEPELVSAVIYAESGGDPKAVSSQGAAGLMQLMPNTARSLGVEDRYDAEQNIASGTKYLSRLVERFGSTELALWAYNAGPGAVKAGRMPAETENYVPKVMRLAKVFKGLAK